MTHVADVIRLSVKCPKCLGSRYASRFIELGYDLVPVSSKCDFCGGAGVVFIDREKLAVGK